MHLLDDDTFSTEMHQLIPQYLEDHPLTPARSRRDRWVALKARIRVRAVARSFAIARQRRDTRAAIERGSREAQATYEANPTDAATLTAWLDAHQLLQALHSSSAQTAALHAGVVWQRYGEQSTFWFYPLVALLCIRQPHRYRIDAASTNRAQIVKLAIGQRTHSAHAAITRKPARDTSLKQHKEKTKSSQASESSQASQSSQESQSSQASSAGI